MPAPAVIPAPGAYINAVAVKGFVVELRVLGFMLVQSHFASCKCAAPTPDTREHSETTTPGFSLSNISRVQCTPCGGTPGIFTVTKKARPKQSSDMNFKAWDNNEAAYGLPFRLLLVLKICGRLWHGVTSGSELA